MCQLYNSFGDIGEMSDIIYLTCITNRIVWTPIWKYFGKGF
jgi:hypothetical protein